MQSVINCPTTGCLILFLADRAVILFKEQVVEPQGRGYIFSRPFMSRLSSCPDMFPTYLTMVTDPFCANRMEWKMGNCWKMFSSLIKELYFLFRTPVNGQQSCKCEVKNTKMKNHRVKDVRSEKWREPASQMIFLSH